MTPDIEIHQVSPGYAKFLKQYQEFLQYYTDCQEITRIIRQPCILQHTILLELCDKALQAHIKATNSHKKAVEAYQDFRQQVLSDLFNECVN
jgi:ribosomal protein RSM22 (predicted rRNA methylase)